MNPKGDREVAFSHESDWSHLVTRHFHEFNFAPNFEYQCVGFCRLFLKAARKEFLFLQGLFFVLIAKKKT